MAAFLHRRLLVAQVTAEKSLITDVERKVSCEQFENGMPHREVPSDVTSSVQSQQIINDNAALYSCNLNEDDGDSIGVRISIRKLMSNANGNHSYIENSVDENDISFDESDAEPEYRSLEVSDEESSSGLQAANLRNKPFSSTIPNIYQLPSSSVMANCSLTSTSVTSNEETSIDIASLSKKRGKRRPIRTSTWIKEAAKCLRNSGKEYTSSSKTKRTFPERKMLPPCSSRCRLQCFKKFTEEERQHIFKSYWELGNLEKQRCFIAENMDTICPKYRYVNPDKHRQLNHAFYLQKESSKVRICKLFFRNTLGINDRPIRTVLSKKFDGSTISDGRGKHQNHRKTKQQDKNSVEEDIGPVSKI